MLALMVESVCVFCGSNFGNLPGYREAAVLLGHELAGRQVRLVYGGGNVGLMGTVADACLAAGGLVTGVIPRALVEREVAHTGLTELKVVGSMHERKALMADLSDAFIALPGGFGTFEELFEIATWSQLGLQRKAYGLVNVGGYYDGLLLQADRAVEDGFLRREHRKALLTHSDPIALLDLVNDYKPAAMSKWLDRAER